MDSGELSSYIIKNYLPKDYSANVQNWSVIQDKRGVMYFGNVSGVLEYDGASWRLIKVPNGVVRCLVMDKDGKIFVGGINEIGYLAPDSLGLLKYVSLVSYISDEPINIGDIWRIIVHHDGLYFQTFSTIFLLESNKNSTLSFIDQITRKVSLKQWESRTRFNPIHSVDQRIFVHERNIGVQELINGKLILLPGGQEFAQDLICVMLPYLTQKINDQFVTQKILIGSLRRGLFIYDGSGFEKFKNDADNYLIENRLYYRGALLIDGTFALGTQVGGIVVIDKQGTLRKIFTKNSGLKNNTVWDLYPDREGNLWAALENGISKILYPSPARILDERSGFDGLIQAITEFRDRIYLATSSGIYFLNKSLNDQGKMKFEHIQGISVQSWFLLPLDNSLYCATNDGIFEIRGNQAYLIDVNLRYTYCLYRSISDSTIIYAGLHNGLAVLEYVNNKLSIVGTVTDFSSGTTFIQEDVLGNLWLNDILGNINRLKIPENKKNLSGYVQEKIKNQPPIDIKLKLFKYQNQVYFHDYKNVYSYEKKSNAIVPSVLFQNVLQDTSENITNIYNSNDTKLWWLTNASEKTRLREVIPGDKTTIHSAYSYSAIIGNEFTPDFDLIRFFVDNNINTNVWTGSGDILVNYSTIAENNFKSVYELNPLIRKVTIGQGEMLYGGYVNVFNSSDYPIEINFSQNLISFEYASPSFLNEALNDYQYRLEGFVDVWSEWTRSTKKEYTNLAAGYYIFQVRTRDALGNISKAVSYEFRILPPWYRTWWSNLIGFLLVLSIIYYVIRFRVRYLEKRNIVLETMVEDRTQKINEQKKILEDQANKLQELDQLKSNFFANISHEFRTPLTLIKGQLENVMGMIKDEKVKKKISIAFNNSSRLNQLVNQILDLSKMESGKLKLELKLTDVVQLLKTRIASFESLAEKNRISISFKSAVDKLILNIDKERIEEVFDNLLSNALKFTSPNGSINISVDTEQSEFTSSAVITISDTGIGIPEEKLDHIFDRFFQVDSSSTKSFEGTGLGLAIVKDFVELHGGSITVSSKLNQGTAFKIYLPIEEIEISASEVEESSIGEAVKTEYDDKPSVLVVEDNYEVRNYVKENLEQNFRVEEAVNGEEGINKAIEKIPDLIITDVMMPKVDGFQLCTKLKNDRRTSHIPIIILTAKADEENKFSGLSIGADEFLAKPFSPRELEIRVGNLIHIRQLLREKYKEISVIRTEDIKANPIDKEFLEKVFEQIKNQIENQQFSVQVLADEMAMSVSQLNRKLNALINQSAGKLIRSTKLDYAAKLLEKNAGNITEIAYRVGFADVSSFTNSFKEKFGVSPSEYLKKVN